MRDNDRLSNQYESPDAETELSPWLDEEQSFEHYVGPPETREVLNRWLDMVRSGVREQLRYLVNERERGVELLSLEFVGEYPDIAILIRFRDARRPGCHFGYRWPHLGEVAAAGYPDNPATEVVANFDEARTLRLPEDCDPNEVTWLDEPIGDEQP